MRKIAVFLTLIAASFSFANGNLDQHPAVKDALNNDTVLVYTYYGAQMDGYTMDEAIVHPIYYVIAPVGEHDDCTVEIFLSKVEQTIKITIQILDDGDGNLTVGDFTVEKE